MQNPARSRWDPRHRVFRAVQGEKFSLPRKALLLLLACGFYLAAFCAIRLYVGYGENIAAVIFVVIVALHFPPRITIVATLFTLPANIVLGWLSGHPWEFMIHRGGVTLAGTLALLVVGLLISRNRSLYLSLKFARRRVRVLSGLLPVCAVCRRIRDGKGEWQGMEEYVSSHSEAAFHHALCPECSQRLGGRDVSGATRGETPH